VPRNGGGGENAEWNAMECGTVLVESYLRQYTMLTRTATARDCSRSDHSCFATETYTITGRSAAVRANIPGVYAVIFPVKADAATVSGEASQSLPGPERPL
jgi:hypothetical protein